jgi:hypothetical protein
MEAVQALTAFKRVSNELALKDQYIRDAFLEHLDGSLFYRLESDIGRTAMRDYESSLNMIRYLQTENE